MGSVNARGKKLFFDFRYRGIRCREYTQLEDKPANRKRMKAVLMRIESEIVLGTFEYAAYFPNTPNADRFASHDQQMESRSARTPIFREFSTLWMDENRIAWKPSYINTLEHSLSKHVNPNGGAIAMGHPLGMSGARIALTAALEMRRRGERRALCSMCVGVGQGVALAMEGV
tara:strand:- start:1583 stop:2101 length:519 start_codon:yes stop_codon:yes gene_type:complete